MSETDKKNLNGGIGLTAIWVIICGATMAITAISNTVNQILQTNSYNKALDTANKQQEAAINASSRDGSNYSVYNPLIYNSMNFMPPAYNNHNASFRISPVPLRSTILG